MKYLALVFLLSTSGFTDAYANEACKAALKTYQEAADALEDQANRNKVLEACKAHHGSNTKFLNRLLKGCEKLKMSTPSTERCKIDAYRYMSWSEYP